MERKFRGSFEYFNIYENIEYCLFLTLIRFFLFRLFKLLEFKWIAEDFYIFEVGERKGERGSLNFSTCKTLFHD